MLKKINGCDIYIYLWVIYNLQGVLYSAGIINRILQLIMLIWLVYVTFKCIINKLRSPILKTTICLVIMYCLYGGWIILFGSNALTFKGDSVAEYLYLQNSLNSLLPIFLFYYYTQKGLLNSERIVSYTIIIVITSILSYYKYNNNAILKFGNDEIVNNMSYLFISIIPFIYFFNKKTLLQYILLGIIAFYMLMGMKRGAIILGTVSLLFFLYNNTKSIKGPRKVFIVIITTVFIIIGVYYISSLIHNNELFNTRIADTIEGNSSNRDMLYSQFWNIIKNETNPLIFIFGRGANATVRILGSYAHQDWLETMINNGIIGVLLLICFYLSIFKAAYSSRKKFSRPMSCSFLTLVFIIFCKTMFSMSIQGMFMYEGLLLGYFTYWNTQPNLVYNNNVITQKGNIF